MRTCPDCKGEKPKGEFAKTKPRCLICQNRIQKEWRKKNPGKQAKNASRSYRKHSQKRKKEATAWAKRNRFNRALISSRMRAKKEGHMPCTATTEEIKAAFTGKCHICGTPEIECIKRLALDHSHQDGSFRGFLCSRCNSAIGYFNDNSKLLLTAATYLKEKKHA